MESETNNPVPPAFYPGQAIPTVLTFNLNRHSSLPHSLNPALSMSLVGTLHLPNAPARTIICVSVSLAEGLELWARDALQAYTTDPPKDLRIDPSQCLPGGTYSLPLTVQVPSTPRLPPTFSIQSSLFAVTYALTVSLTCDDPIRPGYRVTLAEAARPFEMMPETLPTRAPRYTESHFNVRTPDRSRAFRWTLEPSLTTTAYSPTSHIPIGMRLTPPEDIQGRYQVLVRFALIRREHCATRETNLRDPTGQAGLISEHDVTSTMAWFEVDHRGIDIEAVLPVSVEPTWRHGFSTMLNVGEANDEDSISVSSTYHVSTTLAFLPLCPGEPTLQSVIPEPLPPPGVFTPPRSGSTIDMTSLKAHFPGTVRTLPLPIVIGSVSEPPSAMQTIRWSDLHLDRSTGSEVGRVITGEVISCENGWIQAPPSYLEAIETVPYNYQ